MSTTTLRCVLSAALLTAIAGTASAQCRPEWMPGPFGSLTTAVDGQINKFLVWQPPGAPLPLLYAAGFYTNLAGGNPPFNHIAAWDGNTWSRLSTGLDREAFDMIVFNNQLVVGGRFTTAGGTPASLVARWTGSSWIGMGTLSVSSSSQLVSSLQIYNSQLYAGGDFLVGGTDTLLARWDGSAWQRISGPSTGLVTDLEVYGTDLIVGGLYNFNSVTHGIMKYNGSAFSEMGTGIPGEVNALYARTADNSLYAGGVFTTAGGVNTGRLARWDGAWHAVGGAAFPNAVQGITDYGNNLIVCGSVPSVSTPVITQFDGSSFSSLGSGIGGASPSQVESLGVYNDSLYVGGAFSSAGGLPAQNLAEWSGATWSTVRSGPNAPVHALLASGSTGFYVAGDFDLSVDATTGTAHRIFSTDGNSPAVVTNIAGGGGPPNGTNGSILALANYSAGSIILPHNYLIVGGSFTAAGGASASNVAQFDINGWAPMSSGVNGQVNALQQYHISNSNNHVIVTGSFSSAGGVACNNIAQWNGAWTALGAGLTGVSGNALALFNGEIYAGGTFTSAGGVPASDLAHWNGTSWSAADSTSFVDGIDALTVFNGQLIAAGSFQALSGPNTNIHTAAAWTGSAWIPMHSGLPGLGSGFFPTSLAVHDGILYLGGQFSIVDSPGDGSFNSTVYRWVGTTWVPAAGPLSGGVYALASAAGNLWAGGSFTVGDGHNTPYLAKLTCACYANCDGSTTFPALSINDFICYQSAFAAGNAYANCDGSTSAPTLTVNDFICFQSRFAAGCP